MAQRAHVLDPPINDVILAYKREGPISVSETTYMRVALDDPGTKWELHDGLLVEKPEMSFLHHDVTTYLGFQLVQQLDRKRYRVRINGGRVTHPGGTYFIPDTMVIPTDILGPEIHRPDILETYELPLPFVAEAWSRSTGKYDVNTKIPIYKVRGDLEIWRIHPIERTVTGWRRRLDGTYADLQFAGGKVQLHALQRVVIDLDELFG